MIYQLKCLCQKLSLMIFFVIVIPPCALATPTIQFEGVEYVLAYVEETPDLVLNEYVPVGQTVNNYTTLIAVEHMPTIPKLDPLVTMYFDYPNPLYVKKPRGWRYSDAKLRRMFVETWLQSGDRSYYEYNMNYIRETFQGVVMYRFVKRLPGTASTAGLEEMSSMARRWMLGLRELQIPIHTKQ